LIEWLLYDASTHKRPLAPIVERNIDDAWAKACQRLEVADGSGRGSSKNMWRECVAEDMRLLGLELSDVQPRLQWREGIIGKESDTCKHGNNRH
jgi:hypothetical protein